MKENIVLGLDIGGSGIKGALVNVDTGKMVSERIRINTPSPSLPENVADTIQLLTEELGFVGESIGCGFPAIIANGIAKSAANVHESWIGTNVEELLSKRTGKRVHVLNDADAAGVAEMQFGRMKSKTGVSILLTLGTGIGSALFVGDRLVPNTEFGHLFLKDMDIVVEKFTANSIRKKESLSYKNWIKRLNQLLEHLSFLFSPELIVLGGGVSKKFEEFEKYIKCDFEVKPARLQNTAGIIGAAAYAAVRSNSNSIKIFKD